MGQTHGLDVVQHGAQHSRAAFVIEITGGDRCHSDYGGASQKRPMKSCIIKSRSGDFDLKTSTRRDKYRMGENDQMREILKKSFERGPEYQEGMTWNEKMLVVGAIAAFLSIYTYIVVGAVTSSL